MTIQELKEKKQALEEEIAEKLMDFHRETGLKITSIGFQEREYMICDYPTQTKYTEIEVNIEIKL